VRARLTLWSVLAVAAMAALGVLATYSVLQRELENGVDAELADQLTQYAAAVSGAANVGEVVGSTEDYLDGEQAAELRQLGMVLALVGDDGTVVSNSADLRLEELDAFRQLLEDGEQTLVTVETPGGLYRLGGTALMVGGERAGAVLVARPLEGLRAGLRDTLMVLIVVAGLGTAVVGLGSWLLVGRALDPVRRITRTAGTISREDLSQRIDYHGRKDEVGELAATMDSMLDRLEDAFVAQERFISDVSHELRTPLTIAKGHLQVLDRQPDPLDTVVIRSGHAVVIEELDRMNRLVGDLLTLARATRVDFLRKEPLPLDDFMRGLVAQGSHLADRDWRVESLPGGTLLADQDRLTQVFLNLMQNAAAHTAHGQVVALGGQRRGATLRLWVRDEGEGMSADVRERVFEPFYQGPHSGASFDQGDGPAGTSETGAESGAGLGLAIVMALVSAHGGAVAVESELGRGSRFTLIFRSPA
jgi:two-component system OmpR family sensor kinase